MSTNYGLNSNGATWTANVILIGAADRLGDGITQSTTADRKDSVGGVPSPSVGTPQLYDCDLGSDRTFTVIVAFMAVIDLGHEAGDSETNSGGYYPKSFKWQYHNGTTYVDITGTDTTGNFNLKKIHTFSAITARYLRCLIYEAHASAGYCGFNEVQVYDALPDATPPDDVVLTGATVINQGEIDVAFTTPLNDNIGVTQLRVQRCENNGFSGGSLVTYDTATLTSPFVNNAGLNPSVPTTYYYRAKAYDGTNYSTNWSNTVSGRIVPPLVAGFTFPTSINYGTTLSLSDATTGGDGTKTRVWKIDGFTVTPANADYVNPTFTGLSADDHTVRLDVTDDSGTDDVSHDVFVGTLTGAAFVANSATSNYSSNVPSTITWSIVSGGGSINGSGQYTAPSSGSGSAVLKALNGGRFATKTVAYAPALAATFAASDYYLTDTDFTLTASPSGGGTPYAYEWFNGATSIGTSSTKTLNLPAGSYTIRLVVTDVYGATAEHEESFLVVDNLPFNFVTTSFAAAVKNSAYSEEIEFSGGLGTPTFRVFRGALPTGMSIVDFDIVGTPTVAGLFVFEIEGEDDNGTKIYRWFSILVSDSAITAFTVYASAVIFRAGHPDAETDPFLIREDILGFWLQYLHAAGAVTYSDNGAGGEFLTPSGGLVRYIPANKTQIVTFTISDGTTTRTLTATIYGTLPLNAAWGGETSLDRETKSQKAKGGAEYLREEEATQETNPMTFTRRETYELDAIRDFWLYHRKIKRFYFLDMDTGELYLVRFVSELRWQKVAGDSWTIYANVRGVYSAVQIDLTGYK